MRRGLAAAVVALLGAVLGIGWWICCPTPGESLFKHWKPRANGKAWTISGSPRSTNLVLVDSNGAYQPGLHRYSVYYYIYDRDSHRIYSADTSPVRRHLLDGGLPAPCVEWGAAGARLSETTFAIDDTCYSAVAIRNGTSRVRRLSVFAVAAGYQVTGGIAGEPDLGYDRRSRSLVADGGVLLACDSAPTSGAVLGAASRERDDITGYVRKGRLPRDVFAKGGLDRATSGAFRFDLTLPPSRSRSLTFRTPLAPVGPTQWGSDPRPPVGEARREFVREWEKRLGRVGLRLPDRRVENCFRASLAYLILLSRDGKPVPGPTKYRMFWVRDCAYMADALYYGGQQDMIAPALRQVRAMQLPSGGFLPRSGSRKDDELDAPGEAIYAWVRQYRRTGDLAQLREAWPSILAACRYVRQQRAGGILPASVSAEDLGDTLQQHYWDDFWCIRGLRDAAFAARELGMKSDAAWIAAEAQSLSAATRASIDATMARHSIGYIPNGPGEFASAAAARGTSCALWPCEALDPSDPLVTRSFDAYWRKWIEPSGGGFAFRRHYWPYAGLDLAQGYLMLGQRERAWAILKWSVEHDATRGLYSWPEGMSMNDLTLAEGDMPHGWMSAACVSMVRNMLVRESGGGLLLLSGVPKDWLKPGAVISIKDFPTEFGKVSYRAVVTRGGVRLTVWGAKPPGGYRVGLPGQRMSVLPDTPSP